MKIYEKPMNKQYLKNIEEDSASARVGFDSKNLDIKTDGTVVTYKPEYHKSRVHNISRIFPEIKESNLGGYSDE